MELKKIDLPFEVKKPILALGPQTKNTLCFAQGRQAFLSTAHADLNDPKDFLNFQGAVKYFLKKAPKIIAHDLHPEYQSTKFAQQLSAIPACPAGRRYTLSAIQHHQAHLASCMAENRLNGQKVIGVAFDGTGLGTDGILWGAEFFLGGYKNFQRKARLKEIPLLGAEMAIKQPWRLAAAWLYSIFGKGFLSLKINWRRKIDPREWRVLEDMYLTGFNSPLYSSMGRLFDAVASLILGENNAKFEAELAMELEKLATRCTLRAAGYKFNIIKNKDQYIIDPSLMFKEIIIDLKADRPQEKIALKFHVTAAQMIEKICLILRKEGKINRVVLSGGVFQNKLLLGLSKDLLNQDKFEVFTHQGVSCNDSGISLGQAVIANYRCGI